MRGRGHIFDDLHKLNEMIALRQRGYGPSDLASKYGVDHSTIIYHCRRNGVIPPKKGEVTAELPPIVVTERPKKIAIKIRGFAVLTDERGDTINPGKTYGEYMAAARDRELVRRFGSNASVFVASLRITSSNNQSIILTQVVSTNL